MSSSFPILADRIPEELEAVRSETVSFMKDCINEEFVRICDERNVKEKLNQLDSLLKKNTNDVDGGIEKKNHIWPTPEQSVLSRVVSFKRAELERLQRELSKIEESNEKLSECVKNQHNEFATLQQQISGMVEGVSGIGKVSEAVAAAAVV